MTFQGRMSQFGGPDDKGVAPYEDLALFTRADVGLRKDLFLPDQPPHTTGAARRLNPKALYLACRWDYRTTPQAWLRTNKVWVSNVKTGQIVLAQPVDWGPDAATGRIADLSPGLCALLDLITDDVCKVTIP